MHALCTHVCIINSQMQARTNCPLPLIFIHMLTTERTDAITEHHLCRLVLIDPLFSCDQRNQQPQETEEIIDDEASAIYGPLFYRPEQKEKRAKQIAKADSPLVTSKAIDHALFAEFPRCRYVVANYDGLPGASVCPVCLVQQSICGLCVPSASVCRAVSFLSSRLWS